MPNGFRRWGFNTIRKSSAEKGHHRSGKGEDAPGWLSREHLRLFGETGGSKITDRAKSARGMEILTKRVVRLDRSYANGRKKESIGKLPGFGLEQ